MHALGRAVRPAKLSGKYMKDLFHVAAGGVGGLFRRAPVLVSTGLVPAAVVTVTSTVPVPAEGRPAVSTNDVPP
jgi:hypothetical protein